MQKLSRVMIIIIYCIAYKVSYYKSFISISQNNMHNSFQLARSLIIFFISIFTFYIVLSV